MERSTPTSPPRTTSSPTSSPMNCAHGRISATLRPGREGLEDSFAAICRPSTVTGPAPDAPPPRCSTRSAAARTAPNRRTPRARRPSWKRSPPVWRPRIRSPLAAEPLLTMMVGTLQLSRALTDRKFADEVLDRGIENAPTFIDREARPRRNNGGGSRSASGGRYAQASSQCPEARTLPGIRLCPLPAKRAARPPLTPATAQGSRGLPPRTARGTGRCLRGRRRGRRPGRRSAVAGPGRTSSSSAPSCRCRRWRRTRADG